MRTIKAKAVAGLVACAFVVLAAVSAVNAERLPIKTYTTADGLAHNVVNRIIVLRRVLSQLSATEAMELLLDKLSKTKANSDFLDSMQSQ